MVAKASGSVLLLSGLALAQSAVGLSGTVRSARTGAPVEGASVALERSSLSTSTTADGSFLLSGSTSVGGRSGGRPEREGRSGAVLVHHQAADGPVTIRLLDLSGKELALVHRGWLPEGSWSVFPPAVGRGVQVLSIESRASRRLSFLVGGMVASPAGRIPALIPFGSGGESGVEAARGLASETPDTLRVARSGFATRRIPLTSLQRTGIEVLLEDSADLDAATVVPDPSWPSYMPEGIPPPALGTLVFRLTLQIGAIHDVGLTRFGLRRQYDIKGGAASGDRFSATVLPGGLDYDLALSNGAKEIEQIVILRAGTTPILMRNAGVAQAGAQRARMVLDFEAPNSSSYAWLNTGKFAAVRVVDTVAGTIRMDVHDISKVVPPASRVVLRDPTGVENQSWDCPVQSGGQGASVLTENVTLGSSVSIGASKRGNRNIIPITGGTTKGRVVGKILDGGADYQLGGLDARYTLAPDDGEYVIVRNCGSGTLYPVFEARVAGPYNFLNTNKYVSSSPSVAGNSVNITFYEKR